MYQHIVRESGLVYAFVACPNERPMHSVRELLTEVQSKQKIPPAKLCAALHSEAVPPETTTSDMTQNTRDERKID